MAKLLTEIVKAAVGGLVVAGAVTVGSISASNMVKKAGTVEQTSSSEVVSSVDEGPVEKYSPITEEMKQAAKDCDYEFDPASIVIKQEEKY